MLKQKIWRRLFALTVFVATDFVATALMRNESHADTLADPPVFASSSGVLDIMMVAMPSSVSSIAFVPPGGGSPINPTGWVYQVCPRPATGLSCPAGSSTVASYAGVRLALQPGDTLKIRYVNRLPAVDPKKLKHSGDAGEDNLHLNPTNLHTHGLITPARSATFNNQTFGDYIFVSIFNSANGIPVPLTTHQHGPVVMDTVDYNIRAPKKKLYSLLGGTRQIGPPRQEASTSLAFLTRRRLEALWYGQAPQ
jgi:L-ascorbate oxidase